MKRQNEMQLVLQNEKRSKLDLMVAGDDDRKNGQLISVIIRFML